MVPASIRKPPVDLHVDRPTPAAVTLIPGVDGLIEMGLSLEDHQHISRPLRATSDSRCFRDGPTKGIGIDIKKDRWKRTSFLVGLCRMQSLKKKDSERSTTLIKKEEEAVAVHYITTLLHHSG